MDGRGGVRKAGGFILAASILAGAVGGAVVRQSSVGVLAGVAVGALLALLVWLIDRRR
jgi:hypothetical protein